MPNSEDGRTLEVLKFVVMAIIAILPAAVGYGVMTNRVSTLEKNDAKQDSRIEVNSNHNQNQDLKTAKWRSDASNRIENIEKLTEDIHDVIVPKRN